MRYRRCTLALGLASCLVWRVAAWNHVSEAKLQEALESSGYTLVACKFPRGTLLFTDSNLFEVVLVCPLTKPGWQDMKTLITLPCLYM